VRQRDDGVIEFLGRIDGQVKIRGFRVELGEIEAALAAHPAVADAAALVREPRPGDRTLVAYVVPRAAGTDACDVAALRAWLADRLPAFAVPSAIVAVDAIPLTPNGKVDARALAAERVEALAPARSAPTPTEARLVAILREILATDTIDRDADLFALGLHSMLALRFVARVQAEFGVELALRSLYEDPTLRAIAAGLAPALPIEPGVQTPIVSYNVNGTRPPLIFFHGDLFADGLYARRLASALGPDQPVHAVSPHGTAGLQLLDDIEAMGADYAALIRGVQPHGPYRLGGYCASGLVAYEVARNLRAAGEAVDHVVLLNASPMPPARIGLLDALVRSIGSNATLAARVRDILLYNLARLHAALVSGPRGIAAFVRYFTRTNEAKQVVDPHEPEQPFELRRTAHQTKTSFAHVVAALTYHPRPYDGGVTLIWGEDQITMLEDPTMGWGAVARHVDVVPMHGGHVGSLSGRIRELADTLAAVLTRT
jgi:thioesterase domain-containing protein/aryl carrier-like protein